MQRQWSHRRSELVRGRDVRTCHARTDDGLGLGGTQRVRGSGAQGHRGHRHRRGLVQDALTAAQEAGLVETLKGDGPFTVFAPTDDAFAALPAGTLDGLLADKEALKKVLLYHVVAGDVTADQVVTLDSAKTVEGDPISIKVVDGGVVLNDKVKVTTTDIETSNGVIHVIDGVLLPPA